MNNSFANPNYKFNISSIALIVILATIPLFFELPYRINIFLSWEGAYRLYQGQIPYRDFGLPMGFAYWILPAAFFHIFGAKLFTLVIAQVFINIISGMAFLWILVSLKVRPGIRFLSVFLFCISYSFINFWPWYNHTVIVYQLIGLAFLIHYMCTEPSKFNWLHLILGAFFLFISFFTKQDGGALGLLIGLSLVLYYSIIHRSFKPILIFSTSLALIAAAIVLPFLQYSFAYWFNYGQPPHYSRLSAIDFLTVILGKSHWEKFYFLVIGLIFIQRVKDVKSFFFNKNEMIFLLLTLGIIVEALFFQVTSYVPPDNNIFFHSFAFAYVLSHLNFSFNFEKKRIIAAASLLVLIWWSGTYWKYTEKILLRINPNLFKPTENVISINTWNKGKDRLQEPTTPNKTLGAWETSKLPAFQRIRLPESTNAGIDRLMGLAIVKEKKENLKFLNMSELTPLAYELKYKLTTGENYPLWFHKGVSLFQEHEDYFCSKVRDQEYDVVLFEYLGLNNFYPFSVRDCLYEHYEKIDEFAAPRSDGYTPIEVFVRKESFSNIELITADQ